MSDQTKPAKRPTDKQIQRARALLNTVRDLDEAEKVAKMRDHIGRFFKYRNCYSTPQSESDRWWLYGCVQSAEAYVGAKGFTFQRASDNRIEIELDARIHVEMGWKEISFEEFWDAAGELRDFVIGLLSRPASVRPSSKVARHKKRGVRA